MEGTEKTGPLKLGYQVIKQLSIVEFATRCSPFQQ